MKHSVRTLLIISFLVMMIPVLVFLFANNWYAKHVVLDKVTETYRNTLNVFVEHTDQTMQDIDNYLNKMSILDQDVGLLTSYPYGSDNYVLTKIRIQNVINRDILFNNSIHTIFLYNKNDLIFSVPQGQSYSGMQLVLTDNIEKMIDEQTEVAKGRWTQWYDPRVSGGDFLIRLKEVANSGLYIGAIVNLSAVLDQLSTLWIDSKIGESAIYSSDGIRLVQHESNLDFLITKQDLLQGDKGYRFVKGTTTGIRFLMMNRASKMADITTSVLVPESGMLRGLPYFQKATYFMALGIIALFGLYMFFIRKTLFKPLQLLIGGMKKISLGMLDIRLQTNKTMEFVFMANTFNNMAEQIKNLRIGMYEEQLRAQMIELKQLQAQINPHFYMNSLNIIYNFAALKDNDSVKKMALHLGDYFRFIMRGNRDHVTLEEELKHIRGYIEIQKYRYPDILEYQVNIPEGCSGTQLPALTLQPFIENAIIHGFTNHKKVFRIETHCELQEGERGQILVLRIEDSGDGFPPDVLQSLNAENPLPATETSRLGIVNVLQRLKLRYNGRAVVAFYNLPDTGGAGVRIQLPLPQELL